MKKLLRVFPRRTSFTPRDPYAVIGDPPMPFALPPGISEVHISVSFTWDIEEGKRLLIAWRQYFTGKVSLGGPVFKSSCGDFVPGRYIKHGITFTSRGCNGYCPWCLVPEREGKLSPISNFEAGHIVQDNNLLQCPPSHIARVCEMLKGQHNIQFSGGLDSRLLTDTVADQLRDLRIGQIFLACDTKGGLEPLRKAIGKLKGLSRDKLRCYVLIGFNGETISAATERLEQVWEAGAMPFAQLYQPSDKYIKYPKEWRHLARAWSRPAAMRSLHKENK